MLEPFIISFPPEAVEFQTPKTRPLIFQPVLEKHRYVQISEGALSLPKDRRPHPCANLPLTTEKCTTLFRTILGIQVQAEQQNRTKGGS